MFIGKQLCRSPFLNKVAGGRSIKKRLQHRFFKNTSGRLFWKFLFFFIFYFLFFLTVLYMHSRNNWNFSRKVYFSNNWVIFAGCFLSCLFFIRWSQGILISLATEENSDYIDKVSMQASTLQKFTQKFMLFRVFLKFALFNQSSLLLLLLLLLILLLSLLSLFFFIIIIIIIIINDLFQFGL